MKNDPKNQYLATPTLYRQFPVFHILEGFLKIPLREKLQSIFLNCGYLCVQETEYFLNNIPNKLGEGEMAKKLGKHQI